MKLVEADRQGPGSVDNDAETTTPPRPERRRVAVSFLLTGSVLIGTVVAVYTIFPPRHNTLLTRSLELHRDPPALLLTRPSPVELSNWSKTLFKSSDRPDRPIPWPMIAQASGVEIIGATSVTILKRTAALVRYRVGSSEKTLEMTLVVQRARDAPPRTLRQSDDTLSVVSWRNGRWTFVAVGPSQQKAIWARFARAPL